MGDGPGSPERWPRFSRWLPRLMTHGPSQMETVMDCQLARPPLVRPTAADPSG